MSPKILPRVPFRQESTKSREAALRDWLASASRIALAFGLGAGLAPASAQTVGPGAITTTVNVTSGTTTVVGSTTVSTTGATHASNVTGGTLVIDSSAGASPGAISFQTVNGNALQANGGTITVPNGGLGIRTVGGHAVLANGAASRVTLNGTSITTTGVGAGLAAIGGTINATAVTINNTATAGANISAGHGAIAESGGTIFLHAGTSVTTAAFNSVGLGASGANSRVVADALVPVTTNGRGSMGIYLHDGGQVSLLPGSTLNLNGTSSVGVAVDNTTVALGTIGRGLTINLNGVGVAGQAGSTGLFAVNGGALAVEDVTVTGSNAAAGAWARANSSITITGDSVITVDATQNPTAYMLQTANLVTAAGPVSSSFSVVSAIPVSGLLAQGANARITSTGTTIRVTSEDFAAGIAAGLGGTIDMTDNTITTGANSFGVRVDSFGTVIGRDSSITTSGGAAALFFNGGPGSIDLANTEVLATGAGTRGLASLNLTTNAINTLRIAGGSLVSRDQTAIAVEGPLDVNATDGAVITGGGGLLLETFPRSFRPAQQTAVQLDASKGSILTGDALVAAETTANINLSTRSHWTGAAFDVTNVSVGPTSIWTIPASSTVSQLTTNGGLIEFTAPVGDPTQLASYKTLTTRDYVGESGTLALNTYLAADGAPSDILVIDAGTATGLTSLAVRNNDGPGALTLADGIKVIDATNGATTANGSFVLLGDYVTKDQQQAVVGGAYAYTLHHNGLADPDDSDWYLRSQIVPEPPVPPEPPIPPVPPQPPSPRYQPGVPVYEVYPQHLLGLNGMPTMQQRVGNRYWQGPAPEEVFCKAASQNVRCPVTSEQAQYYADGQATIEGRGIWGRIEGSIGHVDPAISSSGTDYDTNVWKLQAGLDGLLREAEDGSKLIGGVTVHIGRASSDVSSFFGDGGIDTNGYGFGGTLTWLDRSGFYADGQAALSWFDSDLTSDTAGLGLVDGNGGFGYALSVETGRKFDLKPGWTVTPQAQLIYSNVDFDRFTDAFGAEVSLGSADSLRGRLGLSVDSDRNWKDEGGKLRRSHLYGIANLYYEFLDASRVDVSGVSFETRPEKLWGGLGLGGSYNWNDDKYSVYGEASVNTGLASFGDSYALNGTAGFRVKW